MIDKNSISNVYKRIYFKETDAGEVVYFGNFSGFIEIGFTEWFREFVQPLRTMASINNVFFVIKESHQYFKKSLYYDDEICIRTYLEDFKYYSLSFRTEILVGETIHYDGKTVLTPVNIMTKKTQRLPDVILNLLDEVKK